MTASEYRPEIGDRVAALLAEFKLHGAAGQMTRRFLDAGGDAGLVVLAEVLDLEAQVRRERRVERLRRASHLPPAKTFETLDEARVPRPVLVKGRERDRGPTPTSRPLRGDHRLASPCADRCGVSPDREVASMWRSQQDPLRRALS